MSSIMVINAKGGSGKTTISTNLASYYANSGFKVTLVDLDPQGSSSKWLSSRPITKAKIRGVTSLPPQKVSKKEDEIFDVPAAIYGARLQTYIKKARKIIVPVLPSPIDMSAAKDFLNSLRNLGSVIRNRTDICLVANRCRANTNIFEELDDYLVKEKGIRYVTAFRDNTNYINAAKRGLGIFEMGEAMTAQDREEWKPLLSWLKRKKKK
jgi:chromosome partitioning protein